MEKRSVLRSYLTVDLVVPGISDLGGGGGLAMSSERKWISRVDRQSLALIDQATYRSCFSPGCHMMHFLKFYLLIYAKITDDSRADN